MKTTKTKTRTLVETNGFIPHGEQCCADPACGARTAVTAVKRTYCTGYGSDCPPVDHPDDTIPVAFADGRTGDVLSDRVDHFLAAVASESGDWGPYRGVGPLGAAAVVGVELRAAASDECRRMAEAQRAVRDVAAIVGEFAGEHRRFCSCSLCAFWSTGSGDRGRAARRALRLARELVKTSAAFLEAVREAAPDHRAFKYEHIIQYAPWTDPFNQGVPTAPDLVAAARERLAVSRAAVHTDPGQAGRYARALGIPYVGRFPADPGEADDDAMPDAIAERLAGGVIGEGL
ncbi:hypothetical protein [Limnoglobus roseus]|uniref:Uncharacterized protein n=1 Tax=Limnoglobus roseus TaxID=2598579 RepID=A0A5C1AJ14_9BACT|nr:hypothetical protein [Limnoglobus roseus]QEL18850.1 hypothetical protein PX52LOC_05891 [Limnoglobus roseus]QEL20415.1 hypothetical protein PX52LOC_07509 [Limnoglobus roseus]